MTLPENARNTLEKAKRLTYVHYYVHKTEPTPCGLAPGEGKRAPWKTRIDDTTCPDCLASEAYTVAVQRRKHARRHLEKKARRQRVDDSVAAERKAFREELWPETGGGEEPVDVTPTRAPTQEAAISAHVERCERAASAFNTLQGGSTLTWRDVSLLMELVDAVR